MANLTIFNTALTYSGRAPKPGKLVNSHCATFDGVGDYVDTGVAFSPSGDYEISGWFKVDPTTAIEFIFEGRDANNDGIYVILLNTSSVLIFKHNTTALTSSNAYDDGAWYRFIASKSGSSLSLKIYNIDGTLAEAEITGTDATAINTTSNVKIGDSFISGSFWSGSLANIKAVDGSTTVFHYPLAEGAGLTAYDISGNANHGTITGTEAAIWANTQDVYHYNLLQGFSKARYFNGTSDYIDTGVVFSPSGDYEVSGWFKLGATAVENKIFDGRDAGGDGVLVTILPTSSRLSLTHNATDLNSVNAYDDNNLYRFVASKSGSTLSLKVYNIDGTLAEAEVTSTNATAIATTTNGVIGARSFSTKDQFFAGQLANIKAIDGTTTIIDMADDSGFTYTGTSLVKWPADALPTGITASNPAIKGHNGAETYVNSNPYGDSELIYRGGIATDHEFHPSETFTPDEFMDNTDQTKAKNYVVYSELTDAQRTQVNEALSRSVVSVSSITVENAAPSNWVVVFDEAVTATDAGWTLKINGTPATITGTAGSGTDTITFTTTEVVANGNTLTADYNPATGDVFGVADIAPLNGFTAQGVINNVL